MRERMTKKTDKKNGGDREPQKEKVDGGKSKKKERGEVRNVHRGLKALKIRKYQSNTDTLTKKLPFQKVVREIARGSELTYTSKVWIQ